MWYAWRQEPSRGWQRHWTAGPPFWLASLRSCWIQAGTEPEGPPDELQWARKSFFQTGLPDAFVLGISKEENIPTDHPKMVVLNWGWVCSPTPNRRHLAVPGDIFLCDLVRVCYWHLVLKSQGCPCKHPTMQSPSQQRVLWSKMSILFTVENPCLKIALCCLVDFSKRMSHRMNFMLLNCQERSIAYLDGSLQSEEQEENGMSSVHLPAPWCFHFLCMFCDPKVVAH